MEALSQGTPVVVIPQNIADERVNAMRIEELGLGIRLDEAALTPEGLRDAISLVSDNPTYYARVQKMQEEIEKAGGYIRAADILQEYVKLPVR